MSSATEEDECIPAPDVKSGGSKPKTQKSAHKQMIKTILWKEWREQRWKLAFGSVMLLFFTGSLLASRVATDKEVVLVTWFFGGFVLAFYSAIGVFAPEQTNRTTTFLASKPLETWKVFACKWLMGWLNFVVPMLICGLCLQLIWLGWDIGYVTRGFIGSVCVTTIFYSMTCCLAPRKSSEALVGFVGLIVIIAIMFHGLLVEGVFRRSVVEMENPTYFYQMISFVSPVYWIPISVQERFRENLNLYLFFVIQAVLFTMVIWVGLRKWRRSI